MKEILIKNHVVLVDDEDYERVIKFNWTITTPRGNTTNYVIADVNKTIGLHRLILNAIDAEGVIDHIDGNGLNNQKSNLRLATHSQNSFHRTRPHKCNTSGYRGVYKVYKNKVWKGHWKAKISNKYLGFFYSAEEAARAFDKAARETYKDFSGLLNFPNEY